MIHAFALDPRLVATWGRLAEFRFIHDKFGLGTPRVLLELPAFSKWKRAVYAAANELALSQADMKRIEELFRLFSEHKSRGADSVYDGSSSSGGGSATGATSSTTASFSRTSAACRSAWVSTLARQARPTISFSFRARNTSVVGRSMSMIMARLSGLTHPLRSKAPASRDHREGAADPRAAG